MRTTAALFVYSLLLLGLAATTTHYVGPSDECAYLTAARDGHCVYDGRPYVVHPPVYPLAIRVISALGPSLPVAATLLGIVCCAGLVALTHRLALAVGVSELGALVAALGLAASRVLAFTALGAFREPLEVLLLYGTLLALLGDRVFLGAVLAGFAALTYDLTGLAMPLVVLGGFVLRRRRAGAVIGVAGALAWAAWALWRWRLLVRDGAYPAGIDGMLEATSPFPLAAFVNPNFLMETARHNAHYWPTSATPQRLLYLVGPSLLSSETLVLDVPEGGLYAVGAAVWVGLAIGGLAFGATGEKWRKLVAVALPVALVGAAGLAGKQARYSFPLVPLVFVLAGVCVDRLASRLSRREATAPGPREAEPLALEPGKADPVAPRKVAPRVLFVLALALLGETAWARPHLGPAQAWVFQTRSVAEVLSALPTGARVAAYHGWPTELAWLLPGRKVLALPLEAERVDDFLAREPPDVVVLPFGFRPPDGATRSDLDAIGVTGALEAGRRFPKAGLVVELEPTEPPQLVGFQILRCDERTFVRHAGLVLPPEGAAAVVSVLEAGHGDPVVREALRANRDLLERSSDPAKSRLAALLGQVR